MNKYKNFYNIRTVTATSEKKTKNFWNVKLKTLNSDDLKPELNDI